MLSKCALISATLIASQPLPVQAHGIYSHLLDEKGNPCCDDRDCRPAPYRATASGLTMFVDGRWIDVPPEKIQYRTLLNDTDETRGGHWCGSAYEPNGNSKVEDLYVTKCAIMPLQAASAQIDAP
jgi:hypothetical protein